MHAQISETKHILKFIPSPESTGIFNRTETISLKSPDCEGIPDVPESIELDWDNSSLAEFTNPDETTPNVTANDIFDRTDAGEQSRRSPIILGQSSHRGRVRSQNEDSVGTLKLTRILESVALPVCLGVVADGMGGHQNGEIASRLGVQAILESVNQELLKIGWENPSEILSENQIRQILTSAVLAANDQIFQVARARQSDMGATVTLALVIGQMAYFLNVGDCRAYHFDGEKLKLITQDHSLVYRLYRIRQIEYDDLIFHPLRHQVLRCLGEPDLLEHLQKMERQINHPYWFVQPLEPGESLLLCSDGLWEMVTENQMAATLRTPKNPQAICDALVNQANQHGGEDNISLILIQMK